MKTSKRKGFAQTQKSCLGLLEFVEAISDCLDLPQLLRLTKPHRLGPFYTPERWPQHKTPR